MARQTYHVLWEIDLDAENPREAAKLALSIMLESQTTAWPESTATVFDVTDEAGETTSIVAGLTCCGIGFVLGLRVAAWIDSPKPLFRCSGCHRDIYPPVIKSMHYRDKSYCAECGAEYWQEAGEALRARMK